MCFNPRLARIQNHMLFTQLRSVCLSLSVPKPVLHIAHWDIYLSLSQWFRLPPTGRMTTTFGPIGGSNWGQTANLKRKRLAFGQTQYILSTLWRLMGQGASKQAKQATSELTAYIWRRLDEQFDPVSDRKHTLYNAVSPEIILTLMLWRLGWWWLS